MNDSCRCNETPFFWTAEADAYAGSHLVREEIREDGSMVLRCPRTGCRWVQDHPADENGARTLRLRWQKVTPGDVVAYLAGSPGIELALLTMDPHVEHQPLPGERILHGVHELRDYTTRRLNTPNAPRSAAISVVEHDDEALVLGQISHNRDGRYVEHRPAAWIVTVRDARVVRVRAFSDWSRARRESGVPETAGKGRRIGNPLMQMMARLARPAYRL
jgi:ketosteroid isomerase-like protein